MDLWRGFSIGRGYLVHFACLSVYIPHRFMSIPFQLSPSPYIYFLTDVFLQLPFSVYLSLPLDEGEHYNSHHAWRRFSEFLLKCIGDYVISVVLSYSGNNTIDIPMKSTMNLKSFIMLFQKKRAQPFLVRISSHFK